MKEQRDKTDREREKGTYRQVEGKGDQRGNIYEMWEGSE